MRKLLLLVVMALAAMALMAPSAFGQEGVTVVDEVTGVPCDNTPPGYCEDEIVSELAELTVHSIFGDVTYVCEVHIPAHIQSNGTGASEEEHIIDEPGGSQDCTDLSPCMEPWTAVISEEVEEAIDTNICIDALGGLVRCEGQLETHIDHLVPHVYTAQIFDREIEGDPTCEFTGGYGLANNSIEIVH